MWRGLKPGGGGSPFQAGRCSEDGEDARAPGKRPRDGKTSERQQSGVGALPRLPLPLHWDQQGQPRPGHRPGTVPSGATQAAQFGGGGENLWPLFHFEVFSLAPRKDLFDAS